MSNQLLTETNPKLQPKTFTMDNAPIETCKRCNLQIRQGGHHNLFLCLYDLKREVEKQKKQTQHMLEIILNTNNKEFTHLTKSIDFQIRKIKDLIKNSSSTDEQLQTIHTFTVELVQSGKQLQKLLQLD